MNKKPCPSSNLHIILFSNPRVVTQVDTFSHFQITQSTNQQIKEGSVASEKFEYLQVERQSLT